MKFAKNLLWVNAALFMAFGVGFMLAPAQLSQWITGAAPGTSSAMIDMRATYGGLALGSGLFWAYCAYTQALRLGLQSSLFVLASVIVGRLAGMAVDGTPNALILILLAAEILFTGLVLVAQRQS